jgi:hypothetical protein
MSFRTLGWFGPNCPNIISPSIFGGPASGNVHDFNNLAPPPQSIGGRVDFPLDVAMKLCWEVDQYIINSSITDPINGTSTLNLTVTWGSVYDFAGFFLPRPSLQTAKEMLCVKGKNTTAARASTLYREDYYTFAMPHRPDIYQNLLNYRLIWQHFHPDPSGGGFDLSTAVSENIIGSFVVESFQLSTPWGNFTLPYTRRAIIGSSSSLSITVTAADPAVRYA